MEFLTKQIYICIYIYIYEYISPYKYIHHDIHVCNIMSKRHNLLPTRTSSFISSAGKIENVQEFKVKLFE